MALLYGLLKIVHILAVVIWIGGGAALATIMAQMAKARDRAGLAALLPQAARFGPKVGGPASGVVLLTGIALVIVGKIGFAALWVSLGFAGIVVHALYGGLVMRNRSMAFAQAVTAQPADDERIARESGRFRLASAVYLLLMTAVIAVMVLKPTA
jgi:uncharacterized membrane protein